MRSSVSSCAEQAKKAAKTFGIATDCDTHESVGHLLIYVLSLQTLWKSSEITSHAFFRSLLEVGSLHARAFSLNPPQTQPLSMRCWCGLRRARCATKDTCAISPAPKSPFARK